MLTVFRMSRVGKIITQNSVWGLEKIGFVPKGTFDVGESLKTAADALVAGGKAKLFTPMALWIVRKVSDCAEAPTVSGSHQWRILPVEQGYRKKLC